MQSKGFNRFSIIFAFLFVAVLSWGWQTAPQKNNQISLPHSDLLSESLRHSAFYEVNKPLKLYKWSLNESDQLQAYAGQDSLLARPILPLENSATATPGWSRVPTVEDYESNMGRRDSHLYNPFSAESGRIGQSRQNQYRVPDYTVGVNGPALGMEGVVYAFPKPREQLGIPASFGDGEIQLRKALDNARSKNIELRTTNAALAIRIQELELTIKKLEFEIWKCKTFPEPAPKVISK